MTWTSNVALSRPIDAASARASSIASARSRSRKNRLCGKAFAMMFRRWPVPQPTSRTSTPAVSRSNRPGLCGVGADQHGVVPGPTTESPSRGVKCGRYASRTARPRWSRTRPHDVVLGRAGDQPAMCARFVWRVPVRPERVLGRHREDVGHRVVVGMPATAMPPHHSHVALARSRRAMSSAAVAGPSQWRRAGRASAEVDQHPVSTAPRYGGS